MKTQDELEQEVIDALVKIFSEHGSLSRRQYERLSKAERPFSMAAIERVLGWGRAREKAIFAIERRQDEDLKLPGGVFKAEQQDPRFFVSKADENSARRALMAGLRKKDLPVRFREMVASLIVAMENANQKLPKMAVEKTSPLKEAVCCVISDTHVGKQVFDENGQALYNKDIFALRMAILKARLTNLLTKHLRLDRIDEVWLLLAGDLVDGGDIYPNQSLNQDVIPAGEQIGLFLAALWDVVEGLLKLGLPVKIRGVHGNHGRVSKYAPTVNNYDILMYQVLRLIAHYEGRGKVSVVYSASTPYLNVTIKERRVHIRHEAPVQAETPAAKARFGGWKGLHDYDVIVYGHKHHPGGGSFLDTDTVMNGSPVGVDDLAELLGTFSRPSQALFGIDKDFGLTYRYDLRLDTVGVEKGKGAGALAARYPHIFEAA